MAKKVGENVVYASDQRSLRLEIWYSRVMIFVSEKNLHMYIVPQRFVPLMGGEGVVRSFLY